jgi:uncharacterized protein YdeI (YjbR/CyaY-like superfamily)
MPKSSKAALQPATRRFEARLEHMPSQLNWVIVYLPFDASKVWGVRGQIKVRGEINSFPFSTSLFPTGQGRHLLLVNRRMQKGARAFEGSVARFRIELDREERKVAIPAELLPILNQDRSLRRWYDALTHSTRNEIAKWVTDPKGSEARGRRAEQIGERLLSVMDAERELPPVLQVAFGRNPRAREGWDRMSASRRRSLLFAIFYYRTPDARARRIEKVVEEAAGKAEKMSDQE